MKPICIHLALLLALLMTTACNKEEGTGGTATIQGRIMKVLHPDDQFDFATDTICGAKEDVYITYGDNQYCDDDVEANAEGHFQFRYLNPGTYTIYSYSSLPSGERVAEKRTVTIKRGETINLGDIFVHEGKAYHTSMIKGWVRATYFDKNGATVRTTWAYDQRVYLQRMDEDAIIDDTRVGIDGTFYFQKLQPGRYIVYTIGQNDDETPMPISKNVDVDSTGVVYSADTLNIRLKA